jgi:hypothetical protein
MYSTRTEHMDLLLEKPTWWTASDRWIPPQRPTWSRPLLARLRMMTRLPLSRTSWRHIG